MIGKNTANWEMARLSSPNWNAPPSGQVYQPKPEHFLDHSEDIYRQMAAGEPLTEADYSTIAEQNRDRLQGLYANNRDDPGAAYQMLAKEKLQLYDNARQGWEQNPTIHHEATILPPNRLPGVAEYANSYNIDVYDPEFERWWASQGPVGSKGGFDQDSPYHRVRAYSGVVKGQRAAKAAPQNTSSTLQELIHATPHEIRGTPIQEHYESVYKQQGKDPQTAAQMAYEDAEAYSGMNQNTRGQAGASYYSNFRPQDVPSHMLTAAMTAPGAAFSAVAAPFTTGYGAVTGNWAPARQTAKGVISPLTAGLGVDIGDRRETTLPTAIEQAGRKLRYDAAKSPNTLYRYAGRLGGAGLEWAPTIAGSALTAGVTAPAAIQSAGRGLWSGGAAAATAAKTPLVSLRAAPQAMVQGARQLPQAARSLSPTIPRYTGVGSPKTLWNNIAAASAPAANNGLYQMGVRYPAIGLALNPAQTATNDVGAGKYQQQAITWLENAAQNPGVNTHLRGLAGTTAGILDDPSAIPYAPLSLLAGLVSGSPAPSQNIHNLQQKAWRDQINSELTQQLGQLPTSQHIEEELRHRLASERFDVDLNRPGQQMLERLTSAKPGVQPDPQKAPATDDTQLGAGAGLPGLLEGGLTGDELKLFIESKPLRQQLMRGDPQTRQAFLQAVDDHLLSKGEGTLSEGLANAKYWGATPDQINAALQAKLKTNVRLSGEEIQALLNLAP